MSVEKIAAIAGIVLSLLFSYVPGLSAWYEKLEKPVKQAIMAMLLIVIAAASYGLACAGYSSDLGLTVTCDRTGVLSLLNVLIAALVANQGMYLLTRK